MKEIHRGRLNVNVNKRWLEAVKIYGNKPIKLLIKIIMKRLINIIVLPEKASGPNRVLNSL
jgi:hypothetical protein